VNEKGGRYVRWLKRVLRSSEGHGRHDGAGDGEREIHAGLAGRGIPPAIPHATGSKATGMRKA